MSYHGKKVVAVDLDGTLSHYDKWVDEWTFGEPIQPMMERVKAWLEEGTRVVIFSARADTVLSTSLIKDWLKSVGLPELEVTNIKLKRFDEFWDDRAFRVEKNTGRLLSAP